MEVLLWLSVFIIASLCCDVVQEVMSLSRKVWLGFKKTNPDRMYAIKVMKKADLINKNLIAQGVFGCFQDRSFLSQPINWGFLYNKCDNYYSKSISSRVA